MNNTRLKNEYTNRFNLYLKGIADNLYNDMMVNLGACKRIDKVSVRPKEIDKFCEKALRIEGGELKYSDPINQIQDQIGARIVTYYLSDVEKLSEIIEDYYKPIEKQKVIPDSENSFGYECKHYILFLPDSVLPNNANGKYPKFFELQIRTLFQHAWAEAEHDIGYKSLKNIGYDEKKEMAFAAAQAWGADRIFDKFFKSSQKAKKKIKK